MPSKQEKMYWKARKRLSKKQQQDFETEPQNEVKKKRPSSKIWGITLIVVALFISFVFAANQNIVSFIVGIVVSGVMIFLGVRQIRGK